MTSVPLGVSARRSPGEAAVPADVEDQVVVPAAVGEVVAGVVDDMVGADRADQIHLRRAAHAGDVRAEGLGQLHGIAADAAGGADDQNLLPAWMCPASRRPWMAASPETATAAACSKLRPGRLTGELVLPRGGVFGEGAAGDAEHLVADPEPA